MILTSIASQPVTCHNLCESKSTHQRLLSPWVWPRSECLASSLHDRCRSGAFCFNLAFTIQDDAALSRDICTMVDVEGYERQLVVTSNCSFLQVSGQLIRSAPLNASQANSLYDRQRALEPLLTVDPSILKNALCHEPDHAFHAQVVNNSRQGTDWLWHPKCLGADHGATLQVSAWKGYGDCPWVPLIRVPAVYHGSDCKTGP